MNTTSVTLDHINKMSIQLFIVTGYTTIFFVTSRGLNFPLILSTFLYMIIMMDLDDYLYQYIYPYSYTLL